MEKFSKVSKVHFDDSVAHGQSGNLRILKSDLSEMIEIPY